MTGLTNASVIVMYETEPKHFLDSSYAAEIKHYKWSISQVSLQKGRIGNIA